MNAAFCRGARRSAGQQLSSLGDLLARRRRANVYPSILIDPDFANANLYSIVVSAGVGNVAAVPEPETHLLLGVSLALLAVLGLSKDSYRMRASRRGAFHRAA